MREDHSMETSNASEGRRGNTEDLRLLVFELTIYLIMVVGLIGSINGPTVPVP